MWAVEGRRWHNGGAGRRPDGGGGSDRDSSGDAAVPTILASGGSPGPMCPETKYPSAINNATHALM